MTIRQLATVRDGRLVISSESVDADSIEVSREQGNNLTVKSDGLYCSNQLNATVYDTAGITVEPKIFIKTVATNTDGTWSVDYSHVGFKTIPIVTCAGVAVGTGTADKRFASLQPNQPTVTSCSGFLHSSSSAGLLAAMTMVSASGVVHVIAIGY